ncbi:MAG: transposase [Candidatus Margulisiibacteriota bacterium]
MKNRRSIRLKGHDYSQEGTYFITLVTHNRLNIFGDIIDGSMVLNDIGIKAKEYWLEITEHYPQTQLDEYVIMPNHIHGIIKIVASAKATTVTVRANNYSPQLPQRDNETPQGAERPKGTSKTIGAIVRGYKIGLTKWIKENNEEDIVRANNYSPQRDSQKIWQRNYYDHIVRNDDELNRIRAYIRTNPINWGKDQENAIEPSVSSILEHTVQDYTKKG